MQFKMNRQQSNDVQYFHRFLKETLEENDYLPLLLALTQTTARQSTQWTLGYKNTRNSLNRTESSNSVHD